MPMSELEKAMVSITDAFHPYSGKEGDKHKLKKSELTELIHNELTHFLGEIKDHETVDKAMEALDWDRDAECDFQEFVAFIARVTAACHEFFEQEVATGFLAFQDHQGHRIYQESTESLGRKGDRGTQGPTALTGPKEESLEREAPLPRQFQRISVAQWLLWVSLMKLLEGIILVLLFLFVLFLFS